MIRRLAVTTALLLAAGNVSAIGTLAEYRALDNDAQGQAIRDAYVFGVTAGITTSDTRRAFDGQPRLVCWNPHRELVVRHPDLLHEVRRQDIAGWLGLTPVAFSRLRRRVHGA